jgi:hypothetical protein
MPKDKSPKALPSLESLDQAVSNLRLAEGHTLKYWTSHGIRPDTLVQHRVGWDVEQHRYTIPYFNDSNELVGVHLLNPDWTDPNKDKWSWAPGSTICPWPMNMIVTGEPLIICEGESDTLRLRQFGMNAVGLAGCNNLRKHEAEDLRTKCYNMPIFVSLDADREGGAAYSRSKARLMEAGAEPLLVKLPQGHDVCSFIASNSQEAYVALLGSAKQTASGYYLMDQESYEWPDIDVEKIIQPLEPDCMDFVELYYWWARPGTAAADAFLIYTALIALSTFIRRRVVWPLAGNSHLHGNLFVMLVAESALYKEDAMRRCEETVEDVQRLLLEQASQKNNGRGDPLEKEPYLFPKQQTPEALLKRLVTQPYGLSMWEESGTMLASHQVHYMTGYRESIIQLYDVPRNFSRETISQGQYNARFPVVSVLAAIQPAILETQVPDEVLTSGFLPRFCLCGAGAKQSEPYRGDEQGTVNLALAEEIRSWLLQFTERFDHIDHETPGEQLVWTPDAKELFLAWAHHNHRLRMTAGNPKLASAYGKIEAHARKLILLFTVADGFDVEIKRRAVERTIACIEYEREVVRTIIESRQDTRYAQMKARVLNIMRSCEGTAVSRSDLLKRSHLSAWELDNVLDTMTQAGELKGIEVEVTGYARKSRGHEHYRRKQKQEQALQEFDALHEEAADSPPDTPSG